MSLPTHVAVGNGAPAIVFVHGLGGSVDSFGPQIEYFSRGHRVLAWTMPGYDTSPPLDQLSFPSLSAELLRLCEHAELGSIVIVGHSLGGYIAQEIALSLPDRVVGLLLAGTTAAFGRPGSAFNDEFLARRLAPLDDGRTPADLAPDLVDTLVGPMASAEVRAGAIATMSRISAEAYRDTLACLVTWDARDRVGSIATPTICVAGELDASAPVRAMQRLADAIPGAELDVIPNVGHLMNLEAPTTFNRILERLLARVG